MVVCEAAPSRAPRRGPGAARRSRSTPSRYLLFVNKVDTLGDGHVRDTLAALQAYASRPLVLRQVPIRDGERVTGYVDVVSERAYRYRPGQPSELIQLPVDMQDREREAMAALMEVLADHDDVLLEKVLEDVKPTSDEIYRQLHKDQAAGALVGVLLGAAEHDHGIRRLWKALRHDAPDPRETAAARGVSPEGEPLAQVFKTQHAGHTGKLSYARIWRGPIHDGATLNGERLGGIYQMANAEPAKVAEAEAGEVVALGTAGAGGDRRHAQPVRPGGAPAVPGPAASRSMRWRSRPRTARTT